MPDADRVFAVATQDGALLPVYELASPRPGAALLLGHANGLATGSYGPWLRELARDIRIFAFDARGNGGSTWPAGSLAEIFSVANLAADLRLVMAAVEARLDGARPAYLGHSLGAAAGLDLAISGDLPDLAAVMLIDPPVFPPPGTSAHATAARLQPRLIERPGANAAPIGRASIPSAERLRTARAPSPVFPGDARGPLPRHAQAQTRRRLHPVLSA